MRDPTQVAQIDKNKGIDKQQNETTDKQKEKYETPIKTHAALPVSRPEIQVVKTTNEKDYIRNMNELGNFRLAALISGKRIYGLVEVYDEQYKLLDEITTDEIMRFGYEIEVVGNGIRIHKNGWALDVRPWPLRDKWGQARYEENQLNAVERYAKALEIRRQAAGVF
jgi:hypothetical protein